MGEVVQHGTSAYLSDDSKAAQQRLSGVVEKEQLLSQPLEEPGGFRNKARHESHIGIGNWLCELK